MSRPGGARPCLVTFHAHPDDEAIFTGGTIATAVAAGWRVVLVVATAGEEGAVPDWLTEDLDARRRAETLASARILGIERVEFLGLRDSGVGPAPAAPTVASISSPRFDAAPVHRVAPLLRRILIEERAAALTSYETIGVYGHGDHIRVHQIAAVAVLGTGCDLMEATVSRPVLRRLGDHLLARGLHPASWPVSVVDGIGTEDDGGLVAVDVADHRIRKLAAIAAHPSQVVEASSFMGLPPGVFHHLLGVEWYVPARTGDGRFASLVVPRRVSGGRPTKGTTRSPGGQRTSLDLVIH